MPQPSNKTANSDVIDPSLLATRLGHISQGQIYCQKAHMNECTHTHGFLIMWYVYEWLIYIVVDQIQVRGNLFVDMSMDCGLLRKFVASSDPVTLDCLP
jgi:hypothetical protein